MARLAEGRRVLGFPACHGNAGGSQPTFAGLGSCPLRLIRFLRVRRRGTAGYEHQIPRPPLRRRCAGCSRCGDAACRGRGARSPLRHGRLYFVGKFEDSRVNTTLNFGASPDGSPALFEANVNCGARAGDRHSRIFPSICLAKLTGTTSPSNLPFLGRPSIISMQPAAAQRRTAHRGAQAELRIVAAATDFGQRDTTIRPFDCRWSLQYLIGHAP